MTPWQVHRSENQELSIFHNGSHGKSLMNHLINQVIKCRHDSGVRKLNIRLHFDTSCKRRWYKTDLASFGKKYRAIISSLGSDLRKSLGQTLDFGTISSWSVEGKKHASSYTFLHALLDMRATIPSNVPWSPFSMLKLPLRVD